MRGALREHAKTICLMAREGDLRTADNQPVDPFPYWQPQGQSYVNESGLLQLWLAVFSAYAATPPPKDPCQPTEKDLTPPPTPPGYTYLGVEVARDFVLDQGLSTAPPGRPDPQVSGEIAIITRNDSVVKDFTAKCDLIVVHIFVPQGKAGETCLENLEQIIAPPKMPPCYKYVGYDLVVNYRLVSSTISLGRPHSSKDVVSVSTMTRSRNGVLMCDIVVGHTFEPVNCPPPPSTTCKVMLKAKLPAGQQAHLSKDESGNVMLFFPAGSKLEPWQDTLLGKLPSDKVLVGTDGAVQFVLPPGTEVYHEEGSPEWFILLPSSWC